MTDPLFVYLVQGEALLLAGLRFPAQARVFALCYDKDVTISYAEKTLFDPICSWTAGRNKLLELALSHYPDADYYVFCDDDIEFVRGSFEQFEAMTAHTRPAIGVPVVPKSTNFVVPKLAVQRALVLDEQMVALHRSVVGVVGIAPLVEDYDETSWYIACLIFEYNVIKFYDIYCHQYNDIVIDNKYHRQNSINSSYKAGNFTKNAQIAREYIEGNFGYYDGTAVDMDNWREGRDVVTRKIYPAIRARMLCSANIIAGLGDEGGVPLSSDLGLP